MGVGVAMGGLLEARSVVLAWASFGVFYMHQHEELVRLRDFLRGFPIGAQHSHHKHLCPAVIAERL